MHGKKNIMSMSEFGSLLKLMLHNLAHRNPLKRTHTNQFHPDVLHLRGLLLLNMLEGYVLVIFH